MIVGDDGHVAGAAGLHLAGPGDDERDVDAAFIARCLCRGVPGCCPWGRVPAIRADGAAEAAVVAGEDEDRVLSEVQFLQFRPQRAHAVIDALNQRGINRIAVTTIGFFGLILRHDVRLAHDRRVDGVVREIDVEGLRLVVLDELHGFVREPVAQKLILRSVRQRGDLVGREIARRGAGVRAADVHIEALLRGIKLLVAQMPFADARGGVTACFEPLGEVSSSSGNCSVHFGMTRRPLSGTCPAIQSVMCSRAGDLPVIMAARVGEHTVQAEYAWVKRMPSFASWSMCGVS
jgi:hypothetical protein